VAAEEGIHFGTLASEGIIPCFDPVENFLFHFFPMVFTKGKNAVKGQGILQRQTLL
jgi:hypothetical protein